MAEPSQPGEFTPFTAPDGVELYARTWKPSGPTKARLVVFHGFSDHVGHTAEWFPTLNKSGIEVHGIDQRGFGKSVKTDSEHGDNGGTVQVMADMNSFIQSKLSPETPLFVAGHSMGGGQVLYWAARGPKDLVSKVSGILAVAPWISLDPKVEPWTLTVALGRLVARVFPRFRIKNKLEPNDISRDPASNKLWEEDELCPQVGTLQMFAGCLDRALELKTGQAVPRPEVQAIWIGHGTKDKITSKAASEAYAKKVQHKDLVLKLYPDGYHALHVDPTLKDEFYQDMADFILARTKASGTQSKL